VLSVPAIYDRTEQSRSGVGRRLRRCRRAPLVLVLLINLAHPTFGAPQEVRLAEDLPVRVIVDGDTAATERGLTPRDAGHADAAVEAALASLRTRGYHLATIDSVRIGSTENLVYVSKGDLARIRSLSIRNLAPADSASVYPTLELEPGSVLTKESLQEDIRRIADHFAGRGFHMASVTVQGIERAAGDSLRYDVTIAVDRGPPVPVERLELQDVDRTSPGFAARAAGFRQGEILRSTDLDGYAARLRDTGAFRAVGEPRLELTADSTAVMIIPVEETSPGTFDLLLGYLPGGVASNAQIVGSGHLSLQNPFGYGRSIGLKLDRRPGQVSSADGRLRDPLFAGLPLRVEASFSGLQQDSTYNRRHWAADVGYGLLPGVEVAARYTVEVTRPGSAGLRILGGVQRIAKSEARLWGLVLRIRRLDRAVNPRSGVALESVFENGDETARFKTVETTGDTTGVARTTRQERLRLSARGYMPALRNQVLVAGADVNVLLGGAIDESDLFRFGGASSLRGYDEDRFRASTALRLLLEYRVILDAVSNAFVFLDAGYVETPELPGEAGTGGPSVEAARSWYPGFGLGMQYETAVGVLSVSYALNDRDGVTNGRVHVGVSFGL